MANPMQELAAENARLRAALAEAEAAANVYRVVAEDGRVLFEGSKLAAVAAARRARECVDVLDRNDRSIWNTRRNGGTRRPQRRR